jgi:hypothetical protein
LALRDFWQEYPRGHALCGIRYIGRVARSGSILCHPGQWTDVSVYVLVAIIKKRLDLDASLYALLHLFPVTLFKKIAINKDFVDTKHMLEDDMIANQLNLPNN